MSEIKVVRTLFLQRSSNYLDNKRLIHGPPQLSPCSRVHGLKHCLRIIIWHLLLCQSIDNSLSSLYQSLSGCKDKKIGYCFLNKGKCHEAEVAETCPHTCGKCCKWRHNYVQWNHLRRTWHPCPTHVRLIEVSIL